MNRKRVILTFLGAYALVTVLCYGLTILVGIVLDLPSGEALGVGALEEPAFLLTVPWHIVINAVTWTGFGVLYARKARVGGYTLRDSVLVGSVWLAIALVIDVFAFVLIKHPYSMSAREFYVEYQPWIGLTYFTVIAGPVAAGALSRLFGERTASR